MQYYHWLKLKPAPLASANSTSSDRYYMADFDL